MVHFDKKAFCNSILWFADKKNSKRIDLNNKLLYISGYHRIHLRSDCLNGSILKGKPPNIFQSLGLKNPSGQKIIKNPIVIQRK